MGESFKSLRLEDKMRLQSLIRELAMATESVRQKETHIKQLEQKLADEVAEKTNSQNKCQGVYTITFQVLKTILAAVAQVRVSEKKFDEFRRQLEQRQSDISRQIREAQEKISAIKKGRKVEKAAFREREKEMKKEIEFHIDTARSTENKAERIQNQLEKYQKPKTECAAQTSFLFPEGESKAIDRKFSFL